MEEELSRVKQNEKLYIIENYDHKFRILIYYFLLPILLMLSLFMFPLKAKALTTIDVTSGIYTTSDCTTTSTAIQVGYERKNTLRSTSHGAYHRSCRARL